MPTNLRRTRPRSQRHRRPVHRDDRDHGAGPDDRDDDAAHRRRPVDNARRCRLPTSGRTYAVGTRTLTFVDSSPADVAQRLLRRCTEPDAAHRVLVPGAGASGGSPVADATPDRQHGPYPLVLFAHGYDVTPDFYRPLLERWAAAGYVVAAPTFPILSGSDGGASHVDYEKTFGDASFVITQVLEPRRRPSRSPGWSIPTGSPPPVTPTARSSRSASGSCSAVATPA